MIEEHGPHLPVGADTIGVVYGGANQLGDKLVHPGRYAIRQSTLRSLVADVGGPILEKALANESAFEAKLADWLVLRMKR